MGELTPGGGIGVCSMDSVLPGKTCRLLSVANAFLICMYVKLPCLGLFNV